MSSFSKILTHPNKNTIVRMLTQGQGVRKIAKYLKERYPGQKEMHVSTVTLQKFRKEKLDIHGEALELIKQTEKEKKEIKELKKEDTAIKRLPAYRQKVKEAVELHVDIRKELSELLVLIKSRTEDLFDKAARGEITINEEANLQRYFQSWTTLIERWAKYVEGIADKTVETNVNITVIEDQMAILRETIVETIKEIVVDNPDLANKFLDRLNKKINDASYRRSGTNFTKFHEDAKLLTTNVEDIE